MLDASVKLMQVKAKPFGKTHCSMYTIHCTYRAVPESLTETTSHVSPPAWPLSTLTSGRSVTAPGVGWSPTMTPMGQVDLGWKNLIPDVPRERYLGKLLGKRPLPPIP